MSRLIAAVVILVSQFALLVLVWFDQPSAMRTTRACMAALGSLGGILLVAGHWRAWKGRSADAGHRRQPTTDD